MSPHSDDLSPSAHAARRANTGSGRSILVVGASGVVGRALLEHLQAEGEHVLGVSRRGPADLPDAPFAHLDLDDAGACQAFADAHRQITHVIYAALYEKPGLLAGWHAPDQMAHNLTMLQNLLDPLAANANLRHVTLLQGTKAYGAHVTPMRIPGLERQPRHPHDNFYWLQEDHVRHAADAGGWSYTIWRPQIIIGHAHHAPMNLLAAIAVYAALRRSENLPLTWPGSRKTGVTEVVDARLLAQAIHFSLDHDNFANQTFNITNGDVVHWPDLWPALAEALHMEGDDPADQGAGEPFSLSETCYPAEPLWQTLIGRHQLQPSTIRELVGDSFFYADALFNTADRPTPPPALVSTVKLRQAGFHPCIDSETMFSQWFEQLRKMRVVPP